MRTWTSSGAGLAEHPDLGTLGVAADDRVVDDDQPLATDHVLEGVELQPDAELAQGLAGLDEGAADVGVLHEALAEGDAGLLGVPGRRRACRTRARASRGRPRRGTRGRAGGPSRPAPGGRCGRDGGVGTGQVDVLEDAALGLGLGEAVGAQAVLVDRRAARRARPRGRRWRRRWRGRSPRWRRPSHGRGGRGPAAGCPAGHARRTGSARSSRRTRRRRAGAGRTSSARCSRVVSGWWARSEVTSEVSLVDSSTPRPCRSSSPGGPGRSGDHVAAARGR